MSYVLMRGGEEEEHEEEEEEKEEKEILMWGDFPSLNQKYPNE